MPVHTRLVPALLLLLAACAPKGATEFTVKVGEPTGTMPGVGVCRPEQPCELVGTMTIEKRAGTRSWASLSQDGTACIALLLPERVYERDWRQWEGKRVRVRGTALDRGPPVSDEIDQLQYRDRWVSPATCGANPLLLYVDELALARGR